MASNPSDAANANLSNNFNSFNNFGNNQNPPREGKSAAEPAASDAPGSVTFKPFWKLLPTKFLTFCGNPQNLEMINASINHFLKVAYPTKFIKDKRKEFALEFEQFLTAINTGLINAIQANRTYTLSTREMQLGHEFAHQFEHYFEQAMKIYNEDILLIHPYHIPDDLPEPSNPKYMDDLAKIDLPLPFLVFALGQNQNQYNPDLLVFFRYVIYTANQGDRSKERLYDNLQKAAALFEKVNHFLSRFLPHIKTLIDLKRTRMQQAQQQQKQPYTLGESRFLENFLNWKDNFDPKKEDFIKFLNSSSSSHSSSSSNAVHLRPTTPPPAKLSPTLHNLSPMPQNSGNKPGIHIWNPLQMDPGDGKGAGERQAQTAAQMQTQTDMSTDPEFAPFVFSAAAQATKQHAVQLGLGTPLGSGAPQTQKPQPVNSVSLSSSTSQSTSTSTPTATATDTGGAAPMEDVDFPVKPNNANSATKSSLTKSSPPDAHLDDANDVDMTQSSPSTTAAPTNAKRAATTAASGGTKPVIKGGRPPMKGY